VSRFIKEIPNDCINEIRLKTEIQRPLNYSKSNYGLRETHLETDDDEKGFYLGQRVQHKMFGEGVVIHFEGQGNSARIQVNFDNEGSKWLVIQYANLEAV